MDKDNQCCRVVSYMKEHGSINCYQASRMHPSIQALHSRISNLNHDKSGLLPDGVTGIEKYRADYPDDDGNWHTGWAYRFVRSENAE